MGPRLQQCPRGDSISVLLMVLLLLGLALHPLPNPIIAIIAIIAIITIIAKIAIIAIITIITIIAMLGV
jgi:hypothetical protein